MIGRGVVRPSVACKAESGKGDLSDPGTEPESGGEIRLFLTIRRARRVSNPRLLN